MSLPDLAPVRAGLGARLRKAMKSEDWGEEEFNRRALELFSYQYDQMQAYRSLCDTRGATPATLTEWAEIPAVPTSLFKGTRLACGPPAEIASVFSTSGTSDALAKGKSHFSLDGLTLMRQSIITNARRMLFPDVKRIHILVLAPSPELAPQMIMAWGMARLLEEWGTKESRFLVSKDGLDIPSLMRLLRQFSAAGEPVTLIGASFGFVNLLEALKAKEISFKLPEGSRIMDAGGYKGRSRELARAELEQLFLDGFGVPSNQAVNLLGMTELASQFYDNSLIVSAGEGVGLKNPPWTRTRVVDPLTLEEVPTGEQGVLCHMDLANLDTPMHVLTDDLGVAGKDGFRVLGRLSADDSRGCSLTVDELTRSRP